MVIDADFLTGYKIKEIKIHQSPDKNSKKVEIRVDIRMIIIHDHNKFFKHKIRIYVHNNYDNNNKIHQLIRETY